MDVLPYFLSHIGAVFDGGVVIDHGSSDGSALSLASWCASRPTWQFGQLDADRFRQAPVSNVLMYDAFEHGADAVMCIDVDEFVAGDAEAVRRRVAALEEERAFGYLNWRPAYPHSPAPQGLALSTALVVGDPQEHRKIVVPRWAWRRYGRTIGLNQGNHSILGIVDPPLRRVGELLHVPIRSPEQLRSKVDVALAAYSPVPPPHITFLAELMEDGPLDESAMRHAALSYGHDDAMRAAWRDRTFPRGKEPTIMEKPFETSDIHGIPTTPGPQVIPQEENSGDIVMDDGRRLPVESAARGTSPKGTSWPASDEEAVDWADTPYSDSFFLAHLDGSIRSALEILRRVLGVVQVDSMLDVGCGVGAWLRVAGDLGVRTVVGVDGPYVRQDQLICAPQAFHALDLQAHRLRLREGDPHAFDLVCSMEVAEHLPPDRARSFVEDLCAFGDTVLFSAAIPHQGGTDHVNEQWPTYWARIFADLGFDCFDLLRPGIWALDGVEWWYRQNVLLFARRGSHPHHELAKRVAPSEPLCLVHPGKLDNAREELIGSLEDKDRVIRDLQARLDHECGERAAAAAALDAVLSSRSWRLTAPLRRARP